MADRSITTELKCAFDLVDVRVLDHFVIGSEAPVSFADRGPYKPLQTHETKRAVRPLVVLAIPGWPT
jgi:hypothetical protein